MSLPTITNTPSLLLRGSDVHDAATGGYVGGAVVCPACDELVLSPADRDNTINLHRSYRRSDGAWSHWTYLVGCSNCDWPRPLPHGPGVTQPATEYETFAAAVDAAEDHARSGGHLAYVREAATFECVWSVRQ